ncbi:MAG: efflux RND transporter permease subunit [Candidatus Caldatribacteriota bacterium]
MKLPKMTKGMAGQVAEAFIHSKLTPVIILVSLLLGLASVYLTPKEEEPQITVPMIDIMIPVPGMEAQEVERNVTEHVERAMWGLDKVEYIYSMVRPHGTLITVRFKVNESTELSLVKVHHKLLSIMNELPKNVQQPEVKSYSIDDVPFLAVTFSSQKRNDYELRQLIAPLARELSSTPDLAKVELLGGLKRTVRVIANASKLDTYSVTMDDIATALKLNHIQLPAGKNWGREEVYDIELGGKLSNVGDIKKLSIGSRAGRIIKLSDVAEVFDGPEERVRLSTLFDKKLGEKPRNVVTISFAKRKGTNIVNLSKDLLEQVDELVKELPEDIEYSIIRNYGVTAEDKANELIEHLIIATISVSLLIALSMGARAAFVVAIAIPVTLALTLAIYYFMGYTLNRVTLFALIFSIGILVDDAIVVVENIERYLKTYKNLTLVQATLRAVSEVGNPTILATFTVIAAILPMSTVSGLMGPYMRPIPIGASLAMIFSLLVAFIVTPWASIRLLKLEANNDENDNKKKHSRLDSLYLWLTGHLISSKTLAIGFTALILILLSGAGSLLVFQKVKVKMLPFDNKNEFQVLLDYPTPTSLSLANEWSHELAQQLLKHPEVEKVQIFNGIPAPFSFSGMVKHTFLRNNDYMADFHVVLTDKKTRKPKSHDIINELRPVIKSFADKKGAVSRVLEIPPGPPVMATLVAEIYGKDRKTRTEAGEVVLNAFAQEKSVVDLDYSWRKVRSRLVIPYDYEKASHFGTKAAQIWNLGQYIFSETPIVTLNDFTSPEEVSVVLSLDETRSSNTPFKGQTIPSYEAGVVDPNHVLEDPHIRKAEIFHRKNLRPVSYVMSELAGVDEAPIYGILKIAPHIPYPKLPPKSIPEAGKTTVVWDGEWALTQEVFGDLGVAFIAVMILIYVLVVGWFKSFIVPLIIMMPIPISLIGIIPGHYLSGYYFSASSMIGFIAGGGVIVRNSIILLDFIEHQIRNGLPLKEAVLSAGILRFRPMLLTASAVVVGSAVMLFDPIFQGLAISMIAGEIAATILSRFAVPVSYYWIIGERRFAQLTKSDDAQNNWGEESL